MKMATSFANKTPLLLLTLTALLTASGCGNRNQPLEAASNPSDNQETPSSPAGTANRGPVLTSTPTYSYRGATRTVELTVENGEFDSLAVYTPVDKFEVVANPNNQFKIVLFTAGESAKSLDRLLSHLRTTINGRALFLSLTPKSYYLDYQQHNGYLTRIEGAGILKIQVQVPANPKTRVTINNKVVKESLNRDSRLTADDIGNAVAAEPHCSRLEALIALLRCKQVASFNWIQVKNLLKLFSFKSEKLEVLRLLKKHGAIAPLSYEQAQCIADEFPFDKNRVLKLLLDL